VDSASVQFSIKYFIFHLLNSVTATSGIHVAVILVMTEIKCTQMSMCGVIFTPKSTKGGHLQIFVIKSGDISGQTHTVP
jgi:hypothetical protein